MKIYECEQLSDTWFELRLGKISGSHFADVLNKKSGRGTYMFKLLAEKLSGEPVPSYSNKAMDFGVEYESEAREYYEALYGEVRQVGFVEMSDYVGVSPDGLIGEDGGLEIKSPFPSTHIRYILENRLPAVYKAQVQGNLLVTERRWWDFVSFAPSIKDRPFWKIRIYRDEPYIKELEKAIELFVKELKELENKIVNKNLNF